MKSIMISIKPEMVAKILNGDQSIIIRKTMPKCELPCKVYIYETKGKFTKGLYNNLDHKIHYYEYFGKCKIVAEFTLNKVEQFDSAYSEWAYSVAPEGSKMPMNETQFIQISEQKGKLDCNDLLKYFGDEDYIAYMWHIDDLKIYDEPRELSEFICRKPLKQPPMDWCYIRENSDVKD